MTVQTGATELRKFAAEYVLPLRWNDDSMAASMSAYLSELSEWIDVTVVDGSVSTLFRRHRQSWQAFARVVAPEPLGNGNGKVVGVVTGFRLARHARVIIADDDVRYTRASLQAVVNALDTADVARPQNYFSPLPWHARWDTARTLINRAVASDYPGTLGVRVNDRLRTHGYSSDALFENLELIRTVHAMGGTEVRLDGVFVRREPPTLAHFLGQRVRQAYDDFAQPPRLALELLLLPAIVFCARRPARILGLSLGSILLAEVGRRRQGGADAFPPSSALWTPLWVAERAVCVWLAVVARARGGVRYGGTRRLRAAHSLRHLTRQVATDGR
jgi:glycosyl transferase family 21